jgi:hypothetical protein
VANTYGVYGNDLFCAPTSTATLDLMLTMNEVSGLDLVAQSVIRRQVTAKGVDISSPNDGIDLRAFIKNGMTQQQISVIAQTVQRELIRDQRVLPSTTVVGSYTNATNTLTLQETIQTAAGPFSLTLEVSQVSVRVLFGGG